MQNNGWQWITWTLMSVTLVSTAGRLQADEPPAAEKSAPADAQPTDSRPAITVFKNVKYAEHGEQALLADVYLPAGDGPFPGVLMIHGGAWMSGSKWHMTRHARETAEAGYTVVAIDYRLAPKHPFPAQIEDCRAALRWMTDNAERYKIDTRRLAAYGYSAGGHLACLLGLEDVRPNADGQAGAEGQAAVGAANAPARLSAIVAGGAPCDFRDLPPNNTALAYFLGGSRAEKPKTYEQASPAAYATADDPPTFFFHGGSDLLVPLHGPRQLMESLKTLGVRTSLYVVPGKGHLATFLDATVTVRAIEFLNQQLSGPADAPGESADRTESSP
ncbi:MAG: alpha/beta hydrolase [Pirellulaceae bacterium]